MGEIAPKRSGGRKARRSSSAAKPRLTDYINLRHSLTPQQAFTQQTVEEMHDTALRILEELGLRILLPEAREIFRAAGASVDEETMMVRMGRDIVENALHTAPKSMRMRAINPKRERVYELGAMLFTCGAGCPHATDAVRGRRPGSSRDFAEAIKLQQSFDVIHLLAPATEPQDVPVHLRHYDLTRSQIAYADKPLFVFARGRGQIHDCLEMIQTAYQLDQDAFEDGFWATTIINSNSPRVLDSPMAQGIIDFARAKQMSIITPFCLAGAMAPITIAGALTLSHAEAMAGITLAQLARPGAPVSYGGFVSNVDMKSGAPAFGTPAQIQGSLGTGQLARHIGIPFRSAAGCAANTSDAQASHETLMSAWATLLANTTVTVHGAGWLEGGLTFGYEKYINDLEALQTFAELTNAAPSDPASIGFDAVKDIEPGGHFLGSAHTMERYNTAFYEPLIGDLSNYGSWMDAGGRTSTERAVDVWQTLLADFQPPSGCEEAVGRIDPFIAKRTEEGGAPILEG